MEYLTANAEATRVISEDLSLPYFSSQRLSDTSDDEETLPRKSEGAPVEANGIVHQDLLLSNFPSQRLSDSSDDEDTPPPKSQGGNLLASTEASRIIRQDLLKPNDHCEPLSDTSDDEDAPPAKSIEENQRATPEARHIIHQNLQLSHDSEDVETNHQKEQNLNAEYVETNQQKEQNLNADSTNDFISTSLVHSPFTNSSFHCHGVTSAFVNDDDLISVKTNSVENPQTTILTVLQKHPPTLPLSDSLPSPKPSTSAAVSNFNHQKKRNEELKNHTRTIPQTSQAASSKRPASRQELEPPAKKPRIFAEKQRDASSGELKNIQHKDGINQLQITNFNMPSNCANIFNSNLSQFKQTRHQNSTASMNPISTMRTIAGKYAVTKPRERSPQVINHQPQLIHPLSTNFTLPNAVKARVSHATPAQVGQHRATAQALLQRQRDETVAKSKRSRVSKDAKYSTKQKTQKLPEMKDVETEVITKSKRSRESSDVTCSASQKIRKEPKMNDVKAEVVSKSKKSRESKNDKCSASHKIQKLPEVKDVKPVNQKQSNQSKQPEPLQHEASRGSNHSRHAHSAPNNRKTIKRRNNALQQGNINLLLKERTTLNESVMGQKKFVIKLKQMSIRAKEKGGTQLQYEAEIRERKEDIRVKKQRIKFITEQLERLQHN